MSGLRTRAPNLAALCCALAVLASGAALLEAETRPRGASLTGDLLVAAPDMSDPRFARTVVFMVRHDATGALGLVVNRPLGEVPLTELL
jgi:hypothetical protein